MKKFTIIVLLAFATLSGIAGISSSWSSDSLVVVAVVEPRTVAVALTMPADFVSVPIRVFSDQKNTTLAYEETRQAIELIAKKVKDNGQFHISMGVASLAQYRGGYGISSGSWSQPAASSEIYLLVPITKDHDNIFSAGAQAARFMEGINLPGKAKYELGKLQLAVDNPEQYRSKLLGLISQEIKKTREAMSREGKVTIKGLESPVMVRQADDRHVQLFLNYSLALMTEK